MTSTIVRSPYPDVTVPDVSLPAFVVGDADLTADQVKDYVAERVAPHKKVRQVEFVDQIPRSLSGKILRRLLVERDR